MENNLDFGQAIKALKEGKRVARAGWNGKGLFVFMQVPSIIPMETVPKMQSLPQAVKDEFERRFQSARDIKFATINYKNQLALVSPDNTITSWAPSVSDALEEDWCILN